MDFENEYFGFKLLPEEEKGNLYIVQRYETNGKADNGLPGLNIVFKKMPNDEELVKLTGSEYNLGTGRDRVQVYDYQVHNLISRYAVTMSDAELTQTISSLENIWKIQEGKDVDSSQLGIVMALVQEAKRRNLGIDFSKEKYVYLNENAEPEDYQMARLMGYKIANPVMRNVGMQEFHSFSDGKKKPVNPTPALAARSAWLAVKISVTLVLMPSEESTFTAFKPSTVIGIFTTMFLWILAISRPSAIIPSASVVVAFTSPLIGPSTIDAISAITSSNTLPSFAIRDGFVVTPQITPISFAFLMSSTFAVSMKNFMFISS